MGVNLVAVDQRAHSDVICTLVKGDQNTACVRFVIDQYMDGVDLSELAWSVYFKNADAEADVTADAEVNEKDGRLYIDWLIPQAVAAAAGTSIVYIEGVSDTEVKRSTEYRIRVLDSTAIEPDYDEDELSQLQQFITQVNVQVTAMKTAVEGYEARMTSAETAANTAAGAANTATTNANNAKDAANTAATNAQRVADTVQAKLDAGDFKGEPGEPGSDASVTQQNIEGALGYTPANSQDVTDIYGTLDDVDREVGALSAALTPVSEKANSAVQSVKIAGTALTKDANNAVDIPLAQNNIAGLYNPLGAYGLYQYGNNSGLAQIEATEFASRSGAYGNGALKAITTRSLDYAVKSAMCDGRGAAWTADEQAQARARMGADGGKWELIETITTTDDAANVIRMAEPNGTAYNFSAVLVKTETPNTSAITAALNIVANSVTESVGLAYVPDGIYQSQKRYGFGLIENRNGLYFSTGFSAQTGEQRFAYPYVSAKFTGFASSEPITSITITANPNMIKTGSIFKIYAKRAY